ncbi:hypothetical protein KLP28_11355 [Nocardioidaceae bacterium]|nr:hypothetical protein KLP28_11355 [Nocardioidaceae bacterium]
MVKKHGEPVEVEGVTVKKPDKPLLPGRGADDGRAAGGPLTKAGLAEHYASVADLMLPHLVGRPISMQRFPDGTDEHGGGGFYEKKLPSHYPDWVASTELATNDGRQRQVVVDDAATLALLSQSACLTPHTWLSRSDDDRGSMLDRPDLLVVDLDPSVDDVGAVRRATQLVAEALDDLGLRSWVKTTGSRGYHVTVPIRRDRGFDDVRGFAQTFAAALAARHPDLLTVEARKQNRGDRVLLDVARNAYAQTVVPPYAVRPRPGAPVALPIRWDEVSRVLPDQHTVDSLPRRLGQVDDPWADLWDHRQALGTAVDRLGRWHGREESDT